MNYIIPAFLLFSSFTDSVCATNVQAPGSIRDLETAYQKFCIRRGEALLPAFSKKLLSLQQQAVNQSDFEKAKQIQSLLQNIKKDVLSPPPSTTIDPFFIGKAWKKNGDSSEFTQFLDSGLRRFAKDVKQPAFQPQDQWADPGKSSREIVVFREEPLRIWFKRDDSTIIQIYKDASIDWLTLQDGRQGITKSPETDLENLHQEFRTEYSKACQPLTQKYLAAVEKRQKQLAQQGNMEEAIAIHNYMKPFNSEGRPVDQLLNGIWKNQAGELYDFSSKSKAAKKSPDGSLKFYLVYTSASPAGEWKMARVDRGTEKGMEVIFFSAGEKVYLIPNKPSRFFSILTRVSGS